MAAQSSRERILDAFEELLTKKSFSSVTVAEILHITGVSKATFYRHFIDKYDLACRLYDRHYEEYQKRFSEDLDAAKYYTETANIFIEKKNIYRSLFADPFEQNSLFQYHIEKSIEFLEKRINKGSYTTEKKIQLYVMIYGTILVAWNTVEGNLPFEINETVDVMVDMMPQFLKDALQIQR